MRFLYRALLWFGVMAVAVLPVSILNTAIQRGEVAPLNPSVSGLLVGGSVLVGHVAYWLVVRRKTQSRTD